MNETITIILSTSLLTTLIITLLGFVFKNWINRKIQYAVKFRYDKQLEEFKEENLKRSKANLVAELLSEWLSFPEDQKNLNKLTFEAFLWLPEPIANKLSKLLSHNSDSPEVREVLFDVRKYLMQNDDNLSEEKIIVFTQQYKKQMAGKPV
ncbi:hypothetical protein FK178_10260 [Antarcticibacterium arcticum]|uniref:Uncharacterized protein n=1 Tax=Antarcticibacterium arcticum TaxID=2585771 RepID=A0A5B8YJG5_9FLAO|nr:hypothetical protein [Antarcticibacterium arcticum]QED38082.1 hypothetical protein FK178_10260 [Antarcticibacterium arcticum]